MDRIFFPVLCVCALLMPLRASADQAVLTLEQGVRLAADNGRFVKMAEIDTSIAGLDLDRAKAVLYPQVDAAAGYTWLENRPAAIFGTQTVPTSQKNFFSYSVTARQLLFDFGASLSRVEAGRMLLRARELDVLRLRNSAVLDFVRGYYDLLEATRMTEVAEREVERLDSHLRTAQAMYEHGSITKSDLLQAEVRISDARQRLLTAQNNGLSAMARVNTLLARPLRTGFNARDVGDSGAPRASLTREGVAEAAEKQRPEIAVLDDLDRSLGAEAMAKRAEYLPRLFAKGGYDYVENRYQAHEGNWSLSLGMQMNLFAGGMTRAEASIIEERRRRLYEERQRTIEEIRLQAETSLLNLRTAEARQSAAKDSVAQAEENLRINRAKYGEGEATSTDVLDAVLLLTVAETNFYRARYDVGRAEASVYYAMGRDLTEVYR